MLGVLLFFAYLLIGYVISNLAMPDKRFITKIWIGGVLGIVLLMWSNIPFSFMFGFAELSHLCGLVLSLAICALLYFFGPAARKEHAPFAKRCFGDLKNKEYMTPDEGERKFLIVLIPFMLFALICLLNHTIYNIGGGYYTGQCTYGDMNWHFGIITSMAEQGTFPPEYNIFPGEKLDYYFLCDSVSSSLYLFGSSLKTAYILPMLFGFLYTFMGFWQLAYTVLKKASRSILAFVLFFLNGGMGLIYFLDDLKNNDKNFTQIFTDFYHTPTNYVNSQGGTSNICWTNTVVDMMLPQRATLFGWMAIFLVLYLLYNAVFEDKKQYFLPAGILAGLLPMIQTYSYFTIGLIAIAWIVVDLIKHRLAIGNILNWLKFGVPALVLSIPQLVIWVFGAVDGESFIRMEFNAYNSSDNWLWFWVKNVGVVFVLLLPAFIGATKKMKSFYSAGLFVFVITEFVVFQTFSYDNNKLYLMWYALTVILVADFLADVYNRLNGLRGRSVLAVILLIVCVNAAVLTMGREMISGFKGYAYELYNKEGVEAAEYINKNTKEDSLFLCYNNHNNIISSLTGRNILVGSGTFLYSHDVDYGGRENILKLMFTDSGEFEKYKEEYGFDYIYLSEYERSNYGDIIEEYFDSNYTVVFQNSKVKIYSLAD